MGDATNEEVRSLIGLALSRKQISKSYHYNAYPYFLKSNGPFKIYDHAAAKGKQFVHNLQETYNQADSRFRKECDEIKQLREHQRS